MEPTGVPARELSDAELERQGTHAHATRNWVFLHGTAEQFHRHTERMLELEQEYLRRHPKRTWQGVADGPGQVDEATRLRAALRGVITQVEALLADAEAQAPAADSDEAVAALLRRVAAAPGGRLHRLELHQAARQCGVPRAEVARLYRADPAMLTVDGPDRVVTDAGRRWLTAR